MKKIPILTELFIVLFLLLVIPTSIVTYYSSSSVLKYSETEIADSIMAKLEGNSSIVELSLNNTVRNVIQLVNGNKFNQLKNINTYSELNKDYESISKSFEVLNAMKEIEYNNEVVYSVSFYLDDSDYVISTNKGVTLVEDYESMDWQKQILDDLSGPSGLWYPRVLNTSTVEEIESGRDNGQKVNVISYIYRLNKLTTSTKGTLVVNVSEEKIADYLGSNKYSAEMESTLINENGLILSDTDKTRLFLNLEDIDSYENSLLNNNSQSGYVYIEENNSQTLYSFYRTGFRDWIYLAKYPMDTMMTKVDELGKRTLMLTILIIFVGTILSIIIATKFSKPMRKLVKELKEKSDIEIEDNKNELAFLAGAFKKMKNQTEDLHKLLREREEETKNLALHNLLIGDLSNEAEKEEIKKMFPYNHYIVGIIAVDNSKKYLDETTHDMRSYQRYVLFDKIEKSFPDGYAISCIKYIGGMLAIIINIKEYDHLKVPRTIGNILTITKNEAVEIMGYTITIGISGVHNNYEGVKECTLEASNAVKNRIVEGRNSVIFWKPGSKDNKKYHYSYSNEKKILNYLATKDFENIKYEIHSIVDQVKQTEGMSYDNILFIFNQLAGSTVKYMAEHNISTAKLFGNNSNIYVVLATLDTLEEIEEYLVKVYKDIIDSNDEDYDGSETRYWEHIQKYINEHYKEDIIFENLAEQIGISYSYLRKLVKEETGKSLMDNINLLRIEEVKRLLLHSNMSLTLIAQEVGYRNVQSVNRFFKKYEGISPSEFKNKQN